MKNEKLAKDIKSNKLWDKIGIIFVFIVPIILTIVLLLDKEKNPIFIAVVVCVWIIAIIIAYSIIKGQKKDKYQFYYLIDYDTLLKYIEEEKRFTQEEGTKNGFNIVLNGFRIFPEGDMGEIFAAYNEEEFKNKNFIIDKCYWNKEEFNSIEEMLDNKIVDKTKPILVGSDSDHIFLKTFKKEHPEYDVVKYIEE